MSNPGHGNQAKGEKGKGANFEKRPNPFKKRERQPNFPLPTEAPLFTAAVDLVVKAGCAIIIGTTRDGGALVLTILDGDDRLRTYCTNQDELDDACQGMIETYA